jgi:hypothetical protein
MLKTDFGDKGEHRLVLVFLMHMWGTFGRSSPHRLRRESVKKICGIVGETQ